MAKVPPPRSATGFTDDDQRTRLAFRADCRLAMREIIRIDDRERGVRIPFVLNSAQERLHDTWENVRAFNVLRSIYRQGPDIQQKAETILGFSIDMKPEGMRPLISKLRAYNILYFLMRAEALGLKISDGPVLLIILKPRQIGMSTYVQARAFLNAMFEDNYEVAVIAHLDKASQNIFRKSRGFYDHWAPEHFRLREPATANGRDRIEWPHGSRFTIDTAGGRENARSFTFRLVHASEHAHFKDYSALAAMMQTMPENATYVQESTARGRAGAFYEDWNASLYFDEIVDAYEREDAAKLAKWNGMTKIFAAWFDDRAHATGLDKGEEALIKKTLDAEERKLLRKHKHITYAQLKWRRRKIAKDCAGVPGMQPVNYFKQEFPADEQEAFQGTSSQVFDLDVLAEMGRRHHDRKPAAEIVLLADWTPLRAQGAPNLTVYERPRPGHFYAIGADVAEGLEHGDYSVAAVLDRTDGTIAKEVAIWRGHIDPRPFGDILCTLGEWYNQAFITPEANNQGGGTCDRIKENRYALVYTRRDPLVRENDGETDSSRIGFYTTSNTKAYAVTQLQLAIKDKKIDIISPVARAELVDYEVKHRVFGAPKGKFDDCVMALVLGYWGATKAAPPIVMTIRKAAEIAQREGKKGLDPDTLAIQEAVRAKIRRSELQNKRILGKEWRPRGSMSGKATQLGSPGVSE